MASLWTPICDQLGIEFPIFGFAHDVKTVAAISNAGGYGVYGATPDMPQHNSREAIEAQIPPEHKAFVEDLNVRDPKQ